MKDLNQTGVIIESGLQDWQILQQDGEGVARVSLAGRWLTGESSSEARVLVRVLDEARLQPVTRSLDWSEAETSPDGTWFVELARIPAGGLYRIETSLQLNSGPIEWARRGDMRHHIGVGDIWVIAGQSNAAGYGKTPCFDAPELGIHMFALSGEWRLATHPLSDSTGTRYPVNREGANGSHSPFLAFARHLKDTLGYPVGLIPAALGGSPLARWVPGGSGDLYENMLALLRDAGGMCRGMVWYQGESDTGPEESGMYAEKFERMIGDFRKFTNRPELPVITAQLNRYIGEPYDRPCHEGWEVIREIQRQIARRMDGVEVISTLDLALSDGIHNDSKGNLAIGERMANTVLGAVFCRDVKYRSPDLCAAVLVDSLAVELEFEHVDGRLHFENNIPSQFPFAVRDAGGEVPVASWAFTAKNRLRLNLTRGFTGVATVTGPPTACPPAVIPFDLCGYLPMLAFTQTVVTLG